MLDLQRASGILQAGGEEGFSSLAGLKNLATVHISFWHVAGQA